jgi:hydroxyacylglutathione hydrolase
MYFKQFYLACLAHASYLLGSEGEAIVVDPQRDVEIYLHAAERNHLAIRHIFETHLHADFVSGHKELAARTGATIYVSARGGAAFPHVAVTDGFQVRAGKLTIKVLETPGHSPDSICLLVTDEEKSRDPWAVLTGDTLFLGDVGRPDLSKQHAAANLAGALYDSLHAKLLPLSDDVRVYPAHGAGSLCGRNMRADRWSTIGTERLTNYALQIPDRDEFVRQVTTNLPPHPDYFQQDKEINRRGASALAELPELPPLSPLELQSLLAGGATALDVRAGEQFAAAHVPGSLNIALSGQFAAWAGALLGLSSRPALIAENAEQLCEARVRLARVGIDGARGYLQGGIDVWKQAGLPLAGVQQISVETLHAWRCEKEFCTLDVRREPEWQAGHLPGATRIALDDLKARLPQLTLSALIVVHCKSGYRSMIACSLLLRAGFENVVNVAGGFDAWRQAQLPFVNEHFAAA